MNNNGEEKRNILDFKSTPSLVSSTNEQRPLQQNGWSIEFFPASPGLQTCIVRKNNSQQRKKTPDARLIFYDLHAHSGWGPVAGKSPRSVGGQRVCTKKGVVWHQKGVFNLPFWNELQQFCHDAFVSGKHRRPICPGHDGGFRVTIESIVVAVLCDLPRGITVRVKSETRNPMTSFPENIVSVAGRETKRIRGMERVGTAGGPSSWRWMLISDSCM
jgi:hypothetical protein